MVHCIEVLVVEDGLERFDEGGKAEGEEKDEGPDGPNDLHSSPSEGVSQPWLSSFATRQVAAFRSRHQRHQQCQYVIYILQLKKLVQMLSKNLHI